MIIRLLRRLPADEEQDEHTPGRLTRRSFLFLGAAAAGGLIVTPTLKQIAQVTVFRDAGLVVKYPPLTGLHALDNDGTIGPYQALDRIQSVFTEAFVEPIAEWTNTPWPKVPLTPVHHETKARYDALVDADFNNRRTTRRYDDKLRMARMTPEEDPYALGLPAHRVPLRGGTAAPDVAGPAGPRDPRPDGPAPEPARAPGRRRPAGW